jgi:predicted nuclease of predicted toxin-antitoxin system
LIPLLLDVGLPRRAAADLRTIGWDVVHAGELGLSSAPDADLLALAAEQGRAVVTLDSDFSRLAALGDIVAPSLIHIRLDKVDRDVAVRLLSSIIPTLLDDLRLGCIASVTVTGVRVRRLPIR